MACFCACWHSHARLASLPGCWISPGVPVVSHAVGVLNHQLQSSSRLRREIRHLIPYPLNPASLFHCASNEAGNNPSAADMLSTVPAHAGVAGAKT